MNLFPRIERYGAICRPCGVVYAGRRAVRIGWGDFFASQNLPVKIIVASAAPLLLPRCSDDWSRQRNPSPLTAPLFRHRDIAGFLNLSRALPGWSSRVFRALHHACKQSSRVFTVSLSPGPFVALFHARNKAWRRTHEVHENSATGA